MINLDLKPDNRKIRQFGLACFVAFGIFGFSAYLKFDRPNLAWGLWAFACLAPVLGHLSPALLKPMYLALTVVTFPLGFLLNYLILGLIFYGVFTPIGLFFRVIGRDSLSRRPEKSATSYWHNKGDPRPAEDYYRQF